MRKVLITLIVILSLVLVGLLGFIWYQESHIFVEDAAYAKNAEEVDLRGTGVSMAHVMAVRSQLPNCRVLWDVPFQGGVCSNDVKSLTITALTEEDIVTIEQYLTEVTHIDASGCKDYAILELLSARLPQCRVEYTVDLGGLELTPDTAKVTLQPEMYDFDTMLQNLVHLPALKEIYFPNAAMTQEQMALLAESYPEITASYTVDILGQTYDLETTQLDLSTLTADQIDEVAGKLEVLTSLESVELMTADGTSQLSMEDVRKLQQAAPNTVFHYVFEFYGTTIATTDAEVIMKNIKIETDTFAEDLRLALSIMEKGDRFVLESRGPYDKMWKKIDSETLAAIREEHRDTIKLVWRIYFGDGGSCLTDAEVIRAVYGLGDDNSTSLRYLEDCRYMDIGHNEHLDSCDFVSGMTSLEAVIISGAPVRSLEPFTNCKELKFLEVVECHYIPDLEPLRQCTKLEMLNISCTEIADISPILDLPLTHLNTINNKVPTEDITAYEEEHPDCWVVTRGNHYDKGWRREMDGTTLIGWYAKLDAEYNYISGHNVPNNTGWYLD